MSTNEKLKNPESFAPKGNPFAKTQSVLHTKALYWLGKQSALDKTAVPKPEGFDSKVGTP